MSTTPSFPTPGPGYFAQQQLIVGVKNANFEYHRDLKSLAEKVQEVQRLEQAVANHRQRWLEYSAALSALDQIMPGLISNGNLPVTDPGWTGEPPAPTLEPLPVDVNLKTLTISVRQQPGAGEPS